MKIEEKDRPMIVIDATGSVLGRLASFVAKQALLGRRVRVVNCEEAIITGGRNMIIREYQISRKRGGSSLKGPNFPKISYRLVKRTIRGMLNYSHGRGKEAFKRILCYDKCPKEFDGQKKILVKRQATTNTIKVSDLSKEI